MQGVPSQRPMAVPTTPGSDMSESLCAARTSSMLLEDTAGAPARLLWPAQPANAPAKSRYPTVRLTTAGSL